MKKTLAVIAAAALAMGSLSGCNSTLVAALELKKQQETYVEIDPTEFYSDEDGYHYPGISWGATLKEFNMNTNYPVGEVEAYGPNLEYIYSADFKVMALGRENTDGTVAATEDNVFYMASYMFDGDELEEGDLSQSELYDQYLEKLIWIYGEPDEQSEEEKTSDNTTLNYKSNSWICTMPDGKVTELQFSCATNVGEEEPVYVTLGVVWSNVSGETE